MYWVKAKGVINLKKKTLVTLLTLGVLLSSGAFGANAILADEESNPHKTLVTRIAQKFNLKEDEVQAVFDAVRDEKFEEMKKTREDKLSQAVSDGVITEEQKQALLQKMDEHLEDRKTHKEEMQKWFDEQGIDETKLHQYMGFGKERVFRMHR